MRKLSNEFLDADLARQELLRILTSFEFRNSQVLSSFLQFIVEEAIAGRSNEIKEYTIGVKALGKPAEFNPQMDAAVRIHAGRLRKMLNEYYHNKGKDDTMFIDVPKGSYVPTFELRDRKEKEQDNKANQLEFKRTEDKSQHRATIAVFPFHNLSADHSKNYFIDGIGEQLCTDLAGFQHLATISYYSTYEHVKDNKSITEIQKIFGINYVITGSIRFLDGVIQMNVQLILVQTESLIWTKTYLRHFNEHNLYSLQDNIIEHILNEIADYGGIITKNIAQTKSTRRPNEFGAYEAIYLYYNLIGQFNPKVLIQLKSALEEATNEDPENAIVWALLAQLCFYNYFSKLNPSHEDLAKGKAYAEKALLLDHYCQHAYKAIALAHWIEGRKEECNEAIMRCLELNTKSLIMIGTTGFLFVCMGKFTQGFQLLLKTSHQMALLPWYCHLGLALYYYHTNDLNEAAIWIERSSKPDIPLIFLVKMAIFGEIKKPIPPDERPKKFSEILRLSNEILKQFIMDDELLKKLSNSLKQASVTVDVAIK